MFTIQTITRKRNQGGKKRVIFHTVTLCWCQNVKYDADEKFSCE